MKKIFKNNVCECLILKIEDNDKWYCYRFLIKNKLSIFRNVWIKFKMWVKVFKEFENIMMSRVGGIL